MSLRDVLAAGLSWRPWVILAGMFLWGISYATQDTLLKAIIASVLPEGRRSTAFGVFYLGYGSGWLVGSVVMGLLYERSRPGLVAFAIAMQLASVPLFVLAARKAGGLAPTRKAA